MTSTACCRSVARTTAQRRRRAWWSVPSALGLALGLATGLNAQEPASANEGIRGRIVDATSGVPLQGASVTIQPSPDGVFAASAPAGTARERVSYTNPSGEYRFEALPYGEYELRASLIGYRARFVTLRIRSTDRQAVSVGLEVDPIALEPVTVDVSAHTRPGLIGLTEGARLENPGKPVRRVDGAHIVSREFLADAVVNEGDVLAAISRLPGVALEHDGSVRPWVRGARWDQTRVTFDGLPLYDPTFNEGGESSIPVGGVGSVSVFTGARMASRGAGGTAGLVEVSSRPGMEQELDFAASFRRQGRATATFDYAGGGLLVAATDYRRNTGITGLPDSFLPVDTEISWGNGGLVARWDQRLSAETWLTVSGLGTREWFSQDGEVLFDASFDSEPMRKGNQYWGNRGVQATVEGPVGSLRARVQGGWAQYRASHSDPASTPLTVREPGRQAVLASDESRHLRNTFLELEVSSTEPAGAGTEWAAGFGVRSVAHTQYSPLLLDTRSARNGDPVQSDALRSAFWGSSRFSRGSVSLDVGARADVQFASSGSVLDTWLSPSTRIAWLPRSDLRVEAAAARHLQFEQAVAHPMFQGGRHNFQTFAWVQASEHLEPAVADIATLGAVWLPKPSVTLGVEAFGRRTRGLITPTLHPRGITQTPIVMYGVLSGGSIAATQRSAGVEVEVRRHTDRSRASLAYTLGKSSLVFPNGAVPVDAMGDFRHVLDATYVWSFDSGFSFGVAAIANTGRPQTRVVLGRLVRTPSSSSSNATHPLPQRSPASIASTHFHPHSAPTSPFRQSIAGPCSVAPSESTPTPIGSSAPERVARTHPVSMGVQAS